MNTIEHLGNNRKNNYDFLRFLAASLVIFSHSFTLVGDKDPFYVFTNNQTSFGHLAVVIFFVISGFLITQSFDRSKDIEKFTKARILRIYPAFIVLIFATVFVLGPFLTTHTTGEYFSNIATINYFKSLTLFGMQYNLPGVFETNPFPDYVNISLWTLPIEVFFYMVVGLLGVIRLLNKRIILLGFLSSILLSLTLGHLGISLGQGDNYIELFRYFAAGMLIYLLRDKIVLNGWFAVVSAGILLLAMKLGGFLYLFPVFGSYLIFYLAYTPKLKMHQFSKYGDFSYGLYIFSFPIQQSVTQVFDNDLTYYTNFVISYPITIVIAALSWHLVEKKALKLKDFKFTRNKVKIETPLP